MAKQTKILFIGLDGASLRLINDLIDEGLTPTLQNITLNGMASVLKSIPPVSTPSAWTSIYTGVNPGKHGIIDFVNHDRISGESRLNSVTAIKSPPFWSMVSEAGGRIGLLGFPVTFPPPAVNGFVISGLLTPSRESDFAFPKKLRERIASIPHFDPTPSFYSPKIGLERCVRQMEQHVEAICQSALEADNFFGGGKEDWDIFAIQFQMIDIFQHVLWAYVDRNDKRYNSYTPTQHKRAKAFYTIVDNCIKRVVDALHPDMILVASDHGFGPAYEMICLNQALVNHRLLTLKIPAAELKAMLTLEKVVKQLDVLNIRSRLHHKAVNSPVWEGMNRLFGSNVLDHNTALAEMVSGGYGALISIKQNKSGLVNQVIDLLKTLRHPRTNEPLIQSIFRPEEIYSGPFTSTFPDLILIPNDGFSTSSLLRKEGLLAPMTGAATGTHRLDGLLMSNTPFDKHRVSNASVFDIAPTILGYLGIQKHGMDGQSLLSCETSQASSKDNQPHLHTTPFSLDSHTPGHRGDTLYSIDEEKIITDRLRDLGYL